MSKFIKKEMTRREFVKTASTAIAVTAVSGVIPTFAIYRTTSSRRARMTNSIKSAPLRCNDEKEDLVSDPG